MGNRAVPESSESGVSREWREVKERLGRFRRSADLFFGQSALGAEQVLERVSQHFQCDLERLKERGIRNGLLRRRAVTLCWYHEKRALKDFSCALVTFKEMRGSQ
jgi:hypothetical protein